MTRIVAGLAGGVRLRVPAHGTRPTAERVREAVVGALDARALCDGARVLDLYAGSGALGLEVASRGAKSVVLVERDRAAASIARANADAVAKSGAAQAAVETADVTEYLRRIARIGQAQGTLDLVFLDPPYDLPSDEVAAVLQLLSPLLQHPATVVVERSRRTTEVPLPAGLTLARSKKYGDTVVDTLETVELAAGDDERL